MQSVRHSSHCLLVGVVLRSRGRHDGQWIQHVISQSKECDALQFYAMYNKLFLEQDLMQCENVMLCNCEWLGSRSWVHQARMVWFPFGVSVLTLA
jgi:hypothetical protein